ncbi:DUF4352 domain-containing protein [Diaminobutyricimonas sp. TR449]|uniref:DUF4352 domain-containing protein n=1 Tax=Diaminobutyricimonas sp. TR449 TaxID=2708076 RepID=UPI00141E2A67|nr:DUF4352 domain-containing protein [Diaminobutyricimonas sp. TR449]
MTLFQAPYDAPPTVPQNPKAPNTPTLGLVFALIGFVVAMIPPLSFLAWLFTLPGLVLSIVGVSRRGRDKGPAIAGIVTSTIGWLISVGVFLGRLGGDAYEAGDVRSNGPSIEAVEPGAHTPAAEPSDAADSTFTVGETVTNSDGVAITVTGQTCAIQAAGDGYFKKVPTGEFCEVSLHVSNGSSKPLDFDVWDVTARIGDAEYEANSSASDLGGGRMTADINPGLAVDAVLYFDVPVGASLERIVLATDWLDHDTLEVHLK